MYREEPPLRWFDPARISAADLAKWQRGDAGTIIPYKAGDGPPMGTIRARYPTPDELFRWRPKEPAR